MRKKGGKNKNYNAEFKISVITDRRENHLGYRETIRKYWHTGSHREETLYMTTLKQGCRYLEEGAEGLMEEHRGKGSTGRPKKALTPAAEEDLTAENQRLKEQNQRLETEPEYIKKLSAFYPAEEQKNGKKPGSYLELRQRYPLRELLKLSGIARSTYYYSLKVSGKEKYAAEKEAIRKIFADNRQRYGTRRITLSLREQGYILNRKTVLKLIKSMGLCGKRCKNERYRSYKGEVGKVAENVLGRDFHAEKPYEKLATDVTQCKVCDKKIYLSPIMDLYNREIAAYDISLSPNLEQVRNMPDRLSDKLPEGATPIFHSDQGWQYQHAEYQKILKEHHIIQSMSRKGNCMDNGAMENFFGRLKVEMYYGEKYESVNAFIEALKNYIDYYNNRRIVNKLKTSPVKYRTCS